MINLELVFKVVAIIAGKCGCCHTGQGTSFPVGLTFKFNDRRTPGHKVIEALHGNDLDGFAIVLVEDRFQASLEEPLTLEDDVLVAKDALVYGRLTQSKKSGTFTGRSELRLELTGIVVNGKMVPVLTGEYKVIGKSRGASTAKRTVGGAALGALIGAVADGGQGAAIGAGVGAGAGAGSEIITGGDQVKVPSETLLEFKLQKDVSIPTRQR